MLINMQLWQMTRKIHPSWLIAAAAVGVVVGTAAVPFVGQTVFGSAAWAAVGLIPAVIIIWRRSVYLVPLMVIAGLLLGLWRGSLLESQLVVYQNLVGHYAQLSGTVSEDPDIGKHGELLLRLRNVAVGDHALAGKAWVSTSHAGDINRGDRVIVGGTLGTGFGSFASVMYQAKLVAAKRPQPGDVAGQVRDWFADHVRMAISEPQASLGLGYLVGQRRALPPELSQALVATGLTHVVVASGYNLTILVRLARRLFVRVSKYLAALSATTMIVGFIAVTGASPSMSRAGLVSGLSLAAWYYGRKFHPLVLLPFAAAVTVLIDPTYAWNDLGWQLSFTAFAGVMIVAPLLQRYFFGDKKPGTIRQILGETISAQILTLPILVLAFGTFSNVAIITNLLVLPLVPIAMLLTFIAGIGAIAMPGMASIIGMPAQWILTYMTSVVQHFANLSWAQAVVTIQPWIVWAAYVLIVVICVYLWRKTKYDLKDSNLVE
jgi:competence protein ComEC